MTCGCKRAIFGNFWPLWRPMAPPKGLSVPMKKPKHIVPDVPWPDHTLIKFNQPVWSLPGELWHQKIIFGHFRPHWQPMAPPRGLLLPVKNPKHIVPDVPWPVQTLIKFDQPVWSLQGDLWLKKVVLAIFGNFRPLWRPMAPPRGLPGPGKTLKHIVPCVSWPDQTLIKVDQPFWGLQGG